MTGNDSHEPVTVTDKRRIDPVTGQKREPSEPSSSGPAPEAAPSEQSGAATSEEADKAAELLADLQRVQADFANYRKRALRDLELTAERGKATVMTALLPILDDLDRAREHGDLESGPLKAFADKLVNTLEGLGLSGFGTEGEEFDPLLHEAVQHEGDGGHPVIGTVLRRGYRVGEQVIRHAMVGVVDTVPEDGDTPDNADAASEQAAESNDD